MHKKYVLKNNLQIILSPQKETKAVTVLVLARVGSRYEKKNIGGISHFLEHMLFKGTLRRPTTLALSRELDKVGAEYNAYTAKDLTGYYIKINSEHLALALDVLSDMIFNSKLEEKELEREKGVIIEEINMYEDNPLLYLEFLSENVIYDGNPLAWEESGTKKSVRAMTRSRLGSYKNRYYFPGNMLMSLAGNFEICEIKSLVEKYFGDKQKNKAQVSFIRFKPSQSRARIRLYYKNTEQAHLALGFLGPNYGDKNLPAAQILAVILGGSMSSRLFINIRERQGLCYYINAGLNIYQDTGNLLIRAGLDKERIFSALSLILNELKKIRVKGISYSELKKAQEYIKGKLILGLEDSAARAEWTGRQQILTGKIKTPEQKINEIMKVSKRQVEQIAKKIFQNKKINLAVIGPFKDERQFRKLVTGNSC